MRHIIETNYQRFDNENANRQAPEIALNVAFNVVFLSNYGQKSFHVEPNQEPFTSETF